MSEATKKIISYYLVIRFKGYCQKFVYFLGALVALGVILTNFFPSELLHLITLVLSFLTILSAIACTVCIARISRMRRQQAFHQYMLDKKEDFDFFENMKCLKSVHDEVVSNLSNRGMRNFVYLENERYRSMWNQCFLNWFWKENDKIYAFRQNPKNEFDDYVIKKHIVELNDLQKKLVGLFGSDSEFVQVIEDLFKSLRKDFFNLIILFR